MTSNTTSKHPLEHELNLVRKLLDRSSSKKTKKDKTRKKGKTPPLWLNPSLMIS